MKKRKLIRKSEKFDKEKHYVDNTRLLASMVKYKKSIKEWNENSKQGQKPKVDDYIGKCLMKIAQRFSYMPKFCNFPYKDEMVSDSIENCLRYIDNFDPEKSTNPFSYFTQIIYYAFLRRIQKESKQQYIKYKSIQDQKINSDDFEIKSLMENSGTVEFNIHMQEFMDTYEFYNEKKPKRKKKAKGLEDLLE
jgi:hypothetical protein